MSRVEPTRGGPIARIAARYAKRIYGKVPEPVPVTAHNARILNGYLGSAVARKDGVSKEQIADLPRARFNWALDIEPQGFTRGACAVPEPAQGTASPSFR